MGTRVRAVAVAGLAFFILSACREDLLGSSTGRFAVEPQSLSFGPTALSESRSLQITLRNEGRARFQVLRATPTVPGVTVASFEPFNLGAGESRVLEVTFLPQVEGGVSGLLEIETDTDTAGPAGLAQLPFDGLGVKAYVSVANQKLDYGNIELGTVKMAQVTVSNPTSAPAPFRLTLEGSDAPMFSSSEAEQDLTVAPGESREVAIAFRPNRLFASQAFAKITVCSICEPVFVELNGFGVNSLVDIQPSKISFGRVTLGASAQESLTITNQGNEPLNFEGLDWKDAQSNYAVDQLPPQQLLPGQTLRAAVHFTPKGAGPVPTALLTVKVTARNTVAGSYPMLPVTGEVGASCLVVLPRSVDFGLVPQGMSSTRRIDLLNRCAGELLINNLALGTTSGGFFTLSQGSPSFSIAAGAIGSVSVTFTPKAGSTTSTGKLGFKAHQGSSTSSEEVTLTGSTRVFSPCQYSLTPAVLDFGGVSPGSQVTLGVSLRNEGTDACFVTGMQLASGSDPEFSSGGLGSTLLPPGDKTLLPVTFKPGQAGSFSAMVEGSVNHPTNGHVTALLKGTGIKSCFQLQPSTVDFGTTKLSCGSRTRIVQATNNCTTAVVMKTAKMGMGTSAEIDLTSGPQLPFTLAPGLTTTFTLSYEPTDDGLDSAALFVDAGQGAPNSVGVIGRGVSKPTQTDRFVQESRSKVDLLFVIDNSGSMMEEQLSLAQNFAALMSAAQAAGIDYHIGVTTTGLEGSPGGWSVCPGGVEGGEGGRLFPVNGSSPRIITPSTPNAAQVFASNVQVGWCHWNEQGLEGAYRALSSPLVNNADDPRTPQANDGNGNFLRPDAKLAIIVVTDEEDFSPSPVAFYSTFFKALKNNDPSMLSVSAIIGPEDLSTCSTASSTGGRYLELANATGGVTESICTQNWASSLQNLSSNAFGPKRRFVLSDTPADVNKLSVEVNGQEVVIGWSYDPATRSVVFDLGAVPPAGAVIDITYPLGC